jgi:death-on-curing protein
LRDDALLKSAPARPQQHFAYGNPSDIIAMATANYWGIVRNHPFVDGNKRTVSWWASCFLNSNGYRFTASQEEAA